MPDLYSANVSHAKYQLLQKTIGFCLIHATEKKVQLFTQSLVNDDVKVVKTQRISAKTRLIVRILFAVE